MSQSKLAAEMRKYAALMMEWDEMAAEGITNFADQVQTEHEENELLITAANGAYANKCDELGKARATIAVREAQIDNLQAQIREMGAQR